MIVAGVMSGTSADGIDVALVHVQSRGMNPRFELLRHEHFPYSNPVRQAVLQAMNAQRTSVAELSRLNFLLGELYADAINKTARRPRSLPLDLIGCHGQTIYHQGKAAPYLNRKIACTWQTGEGAVVASRLKVPVVSDFRPADMACGGQGAPLVPFLDYALFRAPRVGRIAHNIGGIANLTAIPAGAAPEQVLAFDTGPGNMLIDQAVQLLFDRPYDRQGEIARQGKILQPVLDELLLHPFFRQSPPRSAGREEFGAEYFKMFHRRCGKAAKADVVATTTALTAQSIALALEKFVLPRGGAYHDLIVSGGGAKNHTLMDMLSSAIGPLGLKLRHSGEFGVPGQAKEAVAFALLAYQTWRRRPSNLPAATGAARPAILGKISYA